MTAILTQAMRMVMLLPMTIDPDEIQRQRVLAQSCKIRPDHPTKDQPIMTRALTTTFSAKEKILKPNERYLEHDVVHSSIDKFIVTTRSQDVCVTTTLGHD